jgi:protoporphyrinogen oxidase
MELNKVDVVILGGGVTGLSLASFLKNKNYTIFEKDSKVGGYCKTITRNGFIWDYSGHFFHFRNKEIKDYIIKNVTCELLEINKITKIYYKGEFIDFPFQHNIHQLPKDEFIECLYDIFNSKETNNTTFKSYINSILGKSICDKFIIPYNEKLYSCDLNDLEYDSMGRFFPPTIPFSKLLEKIKNQSKIDSYNDSFIYPVKGSFEFIKSILTKVDESKIALNCEVLNVDLKNKVIQTSKGDYYFKTLVNTLPFNTFLKLSNQEYSNLSYNKVGVFNLGFNKKTNIKSHWVYFPGDEVFYRVGFYNNILSQDRMSLYVEIGMKSDDKIDKDKLLNKVLADLKKCSIIDDQSLVDYEFLVMNPAYVHITKESKELYDNWCSKNNKNKIYSIGRYGSWTYCSIEDNIIEAEKTSKIIDNV